MADGPANQRALARGLAAGATLPAILSMVDRLRKNADPADPVRLLQSDFSLWMRSLLRRRRARRYRRLAGGRSAARGSGELARAGACHGLDIIYLLAPTTPLERSRIIARSAERLSLLCLGRGSHRSAYASRTEHLQSTCAIAHRDRSANRRRLRYFDPRPGRRGRDVADAVVVGSAISQLIEANAKSGDVPDAVVGDLVAR